VYYRMMDGLAKENERTAQRGQKAGAQEGGRER
jgi:hypothetical protein